MHTMHQIFFFFLKSHYLANLALTRYFSYVMTLQPTDLQVMDIYIYIYIDCGGGFCSRPMWDYTQSLPMSLEDKTVWALLPKTGKQACGCGSGTLMLVPSTYKAWVGCFSCQCGIALKVFPCRLRTKLCGLGLPKWTNKLADGQEQNPPPQKSTFKGGAH